MPLLRVLAATTAANSPPVSFATGSITTVAVADLVDAETFTLEDANSMRLVFEIDKNGTGVTAGNVQVNVSADTTADEVRDRIVTAINAATGTVEGVTGPFAITASSGGSATVSLVSDIPGPEGNKAGSDTVANVTFANAGLTGATAGAILRKAHRFQTTITNWAGVKERAGFDEQTIVNDLLEVVIRSTAGSATMTVAITVWAMHHQFGWYQLGPLKDGATITETATDKINHAEPIVGLGPFVRIYFEITAIGGTNTAIEGGLVAP